MFTKKTRWTSRLWRLLCLLTLMSALAAITVWESLPALWQGILVAPGLLVALLLVVASYADSLGRADA